MKIAAREVAGTWEVVGAVALAGEVAEPVLERPPPVTPPSWLWCNVFCGQQ